MVHARVHFKRGSPRFLMVMSAWKLLLPLPPSHWLTIAHATLHPVAACAEPAVKPVGRFTREGDGQKLGGLRLGGTRCPVDRRAVVDEREAVVIPAAAGRA